MNSDPTASQARQPLVGYLSNEQWDALLAEVNSLVQQMDALPPGETKDSVFRLLDGVDAMHREALRRLVRLFKDGVLEKVVSDPAIRTLMDLYDLLPESSESSESSESTESPQPPAPARTFATIPIRVVPPTPQRFPRWVPVLARRDDLAAGTVRECQVDDRSLLLCRHDDEIFAVDSRCARDGSSLRDATLSGYMLTCPQHPGCHYDVRQGSPMGAGTGIACLPIQMDDQGRVLAGLDMEFQPRLPSM